NDAPEVATTKAPELATAPAPVIKAPALAPRVPLVAALPSIQAPTVSAPKVSAKQPEVVPPQRHSLFASSSPGPTEEASAPVSVPAPRVAMRFTPAPVPAPAPARSTQEDPEVRTDNTGTLYGRINVDHEMADWLAN